MTHRDYVKNKVITPSLRSQRFRAGAVGALQLLTALLSSGAWAQSSCSGSGGPFCPDVGVDESHFPIQRIISRADSISGQSWYTQRYAADFFPKDGWNGEPKLSTVVSLAKRISEVRLSEKQPSEKQLAEKQLEYINSYSKLPVAACDQRYGMVKTTVPRTVGRCQDKTLTYAACSTYAFIPLMSLSEKTVDIEVDRSDFDWSRVDAAQRARQLEIDASIDDTNPWVFAVGNPRFLYQKLSTESEAFNTPGECQEALVANKAYVNAHPESCQPGWVAFSDSYQQAIDNKTAFNYTWDTYHSGSAQQLQSVQIYDGTENIKQLRPAKPAYLKVPPPLPYPQACSLRQ